MPNMAPVCEEQYPGRLPHASVTPTHRRLMRLHIRSIFLCLILTLTAAIGLCTGAQAAAEETRPSAAQQLELDSFVLDTVDDKLVLRFGVSVSDLEMLKRDLREGSAINLTSTVSLSRRSSFIPRGSLVSIEGLSTLQMDPLTREFILTEPDRKAPNRNKSLKALLDSTWSRMVLPLCRLNTLEHDREYVVALDVTLRHADVPPWLSKTLFFWSWDVAPPISYSMTFTF